MSGRTFSATFWHHFWIIFGSFWHHFGTFGRHFGTRGFLEHALQQKLPKSCQRGGWSQIWAPILEAILEDFRPRGRFFGRRFSHLILERLRAPQNSEKGTQKAPKGKPKGNQKVTFWQCPECALDILFAAFGAHQPSPAQSKKVSKIGAALGTGP